MNRRKFSGIVAGTPLSTPAGDRASSGDAHTELQEALLPFRIRGGADGAAASIDPYLIGAYQSGRPVTRVSTGIIELDRMLGGGVPSRTLTDFYGGSGTGKTQLAYQLLLQAIGPTAEKGEALYVDTLGTFRPERLREMAEHRAQPPDVVLRRIHMLRAATYQDQVVAVEQLEARARSTPVRILIIDGVTAHLAAELGSERHAIVRQARLARYLHSLVTVARTYNFPLVVTNTVRTRTLERTPREVEAAASTMQYLAHFRIHLQREAGRVSATLVQPRTKEIRPAHFNFAAAGLIDAPG